MTKLEQAFVEFDQANPHVYRLLCRFADQAIAAGRIRIGSQLIFERIRWEVYFTTTDTEFKLNNNHVAYYSRKWLKEHPEYPKFLPIRRTRGENGSWHFDEDGQGDFFQ